MNISLLTPIRYTKKMLTGVAALLCIGTTAQASSVIVSSTTNVCTNYAPGGASPFWQTINSFGLSEISDGDFGFTPGSFGSTIAIEVPAGWEFNIGATPSITIMGGNLIGSASITSLTGTTLTFTIMGIGDNAHDQLMISGLQIRPLSTSATNGDLTISITGAPIMGVTNGDDIGTINPLTPVAGTTTAGINASATTICDGTSVTFTANTTNAGTNTLYQWRIDGTDIGGASSATYTTTTLADGDEVTVMVQGNECITNPNALSAATEMEVNALPAAISGNVGICVGANVTFGSSPAAGTWSSDHTAAATINASTGVVTGVSAGTANISYQSPNGCYRSVVATVITTPAPFSGAGSACVGNAQTLASATPGGTWSSDNSAVATVNTSGLVSGVSSGTANITYTVVPGCARTTVFTVNALPAAFTVTGTGSYCASGGGLPVGISGSETGVTYSLYDGASLQGSFTGTGSAMVFGAYTAATTYTVLASNALSCSAPMTGNATITILPMVTPDVSISSAPGDTVCSGTAVTLTATPLYGGTAPVFVWRINGAQVATGNTYNYTPADGDGVQVTLISDEACPSPSQVNDNLTMVVVPSLSPAVTINATSSSICQYSPMTFNVASYANGGTAPTFTWAIDGISTGITGNSYTYAPADGDIVTASINSNYRCPATNNVPSNAVTMNVDSLYLPVVDITTNTGLVTRVGKLVTFTANVTNAGSAAANYQWFKNGIALNGEISPTYTTSKVANNDSISCVVWAAGLCSSGTPGFNSVKMTVTTGLEELLSNNGNVLVVPNPSKGSFLITGDYSTLANDNVHISVTNLLGQLVRTINCAPTNGHTEIAIDATELPDGIYLLRIQGVGYMATTRIAIEH